METINKILLVIKSNITCGKMCGRNCLGPRCRKS